MSTEYAVVELPVVLEHYKPPVWVHPHIDSEDDLSIRISSLWIGITHVSAIEKELNKVLYFWEVTPDQIKHVSNTVVDGTMHSVFTVVQIIRDLTVEITATFIFNPDAGITTLKTSSVKLPTEWYGVYDTITGVGYELDVRRTNLVTRKNKRKQRW